MGSQEWVRGQKFLASRATAGNELGPAKAAARTVPPASPTPGAGWEGGGRWEELDGGKAPLRPILRCSGSGRWLPDLDSAVWQGPAHQSFW